MTDRELLELAAEAAGIEYDAEASQPHPKSKVFFGLWIVIHSEPYEGQKRYWNPLTDDGDALRLAVKLVLAVSVCTDYTVILGVFVDGLAVRENHGDDPYAATRRVIVRAAAELAKQEVKT